MIAAFKAGERMRCRRRPFSGAALVTDGRISGASGKVSAAIHVSPKALGGGPLAPRVDGDIVRLCARTGDLAMLADAGDLAARVPTAPARSVGHELFAFMRYRTDNAEHGASVMLEAAGL